MQTVFVTGGAGYVGSALVPQMLSRGYRVKVLDLFIYGREVFDSIKRDANLELIQGDLRDQALLRQALPGCDAVIHLACISNDPSFELNPDLGKSINFDAFEPLVQISQAAGVKRFIYASSSSVYGVKDEPDVNEEMALEPLTDYSKYKALCEEVLLRYQAPGFTTVIIRPATVCGYAPRQRLDVIVNILTNHAVNTGKIKVFGGEQLRPNIHIQDMVDLYLLLLELPAAQIAGKVFNAGFENHRVRELAQMVQTIVGFDRVAIETVPTDDNRSYHVSSAKIARELGFVPQHTIEEAVRDLVAAFRAGKLPDSMTAPRYFNIKMMQAINLQ
ncbi:NAD-dependent epimerase/dehydratase family protein [Candidatus Amarolinea dominans]|uniref:NAD-dependent epimerase/dehydratase family protein n=1 Tax=Candidatus Amarolinea dominans TaxID=3140696 RepID=UPI001E09E97D|nr:NAD-dependent epimerase/dehydratase family protein [Anaerolineae bacterium]